MFNPDIHRLRYLYLNNIERETERVKVVWNVTLHGVYILQLALDDFA